MSHTIVNLVGFGISAATAVTSPRIHCEFAPRVLAEETYFPLAADVAATLRRDGYELRPELYSGRVCLIEADGPNETSRAASDPPGGQVSPRSTCSFTRLPPAGTPETGLRRKGAG
jgi:gamma-glutamyltranspeptidase